MRLLYHTAHLSDADLAQRALERLSPPVKVEACASVRDVLAQFGVGPPPDAVLVDTSPPAHDPLRALAEVRAAHPAAVLIALVRPGADALAADALVAGADDTLVKHREFFLQVPAAVARVQARRPSANGSAPPHVLAVLAGDHPALRATGDLRVTLADEGWWGSPAEQTLAVRPDVLLLTEARGASAVATVTKALRDRTVGTPLVLLAEDTAPQVAVYERLGIAAVLGAGDLARLPDVVRAVATASRLAAQVAVLRAKEQRLRAIIESVPASVVLASADGTVLAMNVAGLALAGARGAADIVGRSLFALGDAQAADDLRAFVAKVCQGAPGLARFPGRALDGTAKTFEIRAVPMVREQDSTVMLGVMRVAPGPTVTRVGGPDAAEVEVPLEQMAGSPDADAIRAELDALRKTLAKEESAHAVVREQLTVAGTRQAVHEAAWAAIQAELQRKLILQASLPDRQDEHERTRALLEQTVRERDQRLLSLSETLQGAEGGLREAATEITRLREDADVREGEVISLRAAVDAATARERDLLRVLAERDAQLAGMRQELASAQQALAEDADEIHALRTAADSAATREHDLQQTLAARDSAVAGVRDELLVAQQALAEGATQIDALRAAAESATVREQDLQQALAERDATLAAARVDLQGVQQALADRAAELDALRAAAERQAREHHALVDVRQQVARLQAAAATAEQQQRALDEAHDQIQRLRTALEDALGARTDLERAARERDAELHGLRADRDAATARTQALEAELAAVSAQGHELRTALDAHAAAALDTRLADARAQLAAYESRLHEADATRLALDAARGELDAARADAARWLTRALAAEDQAARLPGLHAKVEEWRARHEGARVELESLLEELADARRRGEHAQHLAGELTALRAAHDEARREAEAAGARVAQVTSDLDARTQELERARTAAGDVEAARATLAEELTALRAAHDEVRREAEEAGARAAQVTAELEARTQELESVRARASELAAAAASLESTRSTLEQALAAAQGELTSLQALQGELQAAMGEAETEVESLRARLAAREATLDEAQQVLADSRAQLDAANAAQASMEAARAALDAELASARADVAALQVARNDAQAALAAERAARAALESLGAAASSARDEALAALASREAEALQLRAVAERAAADLDTLRGSLAAVAQERAHDGALLDELRERVAALESELAARHAALASADQAAFALRAAVADAQASREQAQRELDAAREAQRAVLDDQQSLRDQIADLQAQLAGQRQLASEVDADRAALREKLSRADASSQLLASRQREAHEALERTTADLRMRLADLEATAATERAALERALAARDAAFRRLSQSGVVGLATTTAEGALLRCNDALAGFCGVASADELLQRAGEGGLPLVSDWPGLAGLVASSEAPVTVETSVQRPDGGVAWLHASVVAAGQGVPATHLEWTIVDATDRYLRLRQQRQSRRLEAVRDLAVSAGGELLEALGGRPAEALPGTTPASAGRVGEARLRAREIAQQLVAFAQKQARPAHLVDLAEQVAHLRLALVRLVGEDVSLSIEAPPRPLVVTADPAELDHWITSLCVVLRDALPAMGAIAVAVAARDLVLGASAGAPRVAPVVTLSLRATGYGVRAVTLPNTIHDAVAQRGGVLRSAHDAIGGAATVEIHLPAVASLSGADAPFPLSVRLDSDPGR